METIQLKGINEGLSLVIKSENFLPDLEEKIKQSLDLFKATGNVVLHVTSSFPLSFSDKLKIQEIVLKNHPATLFSFEDTDAMHSPSSVFHTGTLRSGQNVQSEGHLVILGDVNPGAEVIAVGNVVVLGSLRGIVHAGANGDKTASVTALHLNPTQIRIADIITRSPDENIENSEPEIAYIKDNRIYIDAILRK